MENEDIQHASTGKSNCVIVLLGSSLKEKRRPLRCFIFDVPEEYQNNLYPGVRIKFNVRLEPIENGKLCWITETFDDELIQIKNIVMVEEGPSNYFFLNSFKRRITFEAR